jgi:hypothetical protein
MFDRLVTIATFHDPVAAALAKNFLASEEIPAVLFDESTVAIAWQLAGAIGGIKLQVAAIHVERAELLLAQIQEEKLADDEAEPLPATGFASLETAEELQAEVEDKEPINLLVDRMYRSAIFGLIFGSWCRQSRCRAGLARIGAGRFGSPWCSTCLCCSCCSTSSLA